MRIRARTLALALGSLSSALLGVAPTASAQSTPATAPPRVALGPVTGLLVEPTRVQLRVMLLSHAGELELRPDAQPTTTRRLEAPPDDAIAEAGREVGADVVLTADTSRRGEGYALRVRAVRASDGNVLGTSSWELTGESELPSIREDLWSQLRPYLGIDAATTASSNTVTTVDTTDPASGAPPSSPNAPVVVRTPGLGFASIQLGLGGAMRSWRVPVLGEVGDPTGRPYGELALRGYDNAGYLEGRIEATGLLRWARDRAGIGLVFNATLPLMISSRARVADASGMETTIDLATGAYELSGGVLAMYRPPGGGLLAVSTTVVHHLFSVDTAALPATQRLAPVTYTGFALGGEGILPVWATPKWELGVLFGAALRVTVVGDDAQAAFGRNADPVLGLAGTAGLSLRLDGITPGLALRATAEFLRYRIRFGNRADVGPAADSVDDYARFMGGVSYAFGVR